MTGYQSKKAAAQDKLEQEPASVTYKEVQDSMNALEKGDLRQQVIAEELGQRKLYTSPPQRQPLTDEQIVDYLGDEYHDMSESELRFFRLGEAATKEKNT